VVLGPGCPVSCARGIGHGLEGDFNRKGFKRVMQRPHGPAHPRPKGVTVLDDGTLPDRRGSISIDDERGTPSAKNVLIEDGSCCRPIWQDRQNARLMGLPRRPLGSPRES